jgi:hypothetical protein
MTKIIKAPISDGNEFADRLSTEKRHTDYLLSLFPDLVTFRDKDNKLFFSAASVNWLADEIEFVLDPDVSVYAAIQCAVPSITLDCDCCQEGIKVYSRRMNIPILLHHDSGNLEHYIYTFSYEDYFKSMNLSQSLLGKTNLFVIEYMEKHKKNRYGADIKPDITFITQNIKKLLPFS